VIIVEHAPAVHIAVPVHAVVQLPQCALSVLRFTHVVPHSVNPAAQPHTPAEQACIGPHACPHVPQFAESVARVASQPSTAMWLQSPKPAAHDTTVHVPVAHEGDPFGMLHGVRHAPQLTVDSSSVSHPLVAMPSQSP
jgi:hypothetical protein